MSGAGRGTGAADPDETAGPVSVAEPGERQAAFRRPSRPPGRTRRSPWRTAFFGVIAVGLLVGISYIFLGPKVLVVRSVVVSGTHLVPPGQVRAAAGIPLGEPLLRVNTDAAARRVEAITQVRSARVSKSWPDRIVITIQERTPVLAVARPGAAGTTSAGAGGYDLIDASGITVRTAQAKPRGIPVFWPSVPVTALAGSPSVAAAATVLRELPAWIGPSVAAVTASSPQNVTLGLSGGVTIVWGSTARATAKAAELSALMRTHAHYYDVSSPGTAVTR
jgi:cell division protein FtsQ